MTPQPDLGVFRAGTIDYRTGLTHHAALIEARHNDEIPDTVMLIEISPGVAACGIETKPGDVPEGFERVAVGRGGRATFHGPGQSGFVVVAKLTDDYTSRIHARYLRSAVIAALAGFEIDAHARGGLETGVWVGDAKISQLGTGSLAKVTGHGIATNVSNDLEPFRAMGNPCGIENCEVTSVAEQGVELEPAVFGDITLRHYAYLRDFDVVASVDPSTVSP